jgi:hypothetical protein
VQTLCQLHRRVNARAVIEAMKMENVLSAAVDGAWSQSDHPRAPLVVDQPIRSSKSLLRSVPHTLEGVEIPVGCNDLKGTRMRKVWLSPGYLAQLRRVGGHRPGFRAVRRRPSSTR